MKKIIFLLPFMLGIVFSNAQKPHHYPFNGFHLGLTLEGDYFSPASFHPTTGSTIVPKSLWSKNASVGLEVSYHFARYFGISAALNWGQHTLIVEEPYYTSIPGHGNNMEELNYYGKRQNRMETVWSLPLKFEFHFPVGKNFYFLGEMGGALRGFQFKQLLDGPSSYVITDYNDSYLSSLEPEDKTLIYEHVIHRNDNSIVCDMMCGLGAYYMLPYGDFLRGSFGVSCSFKSDFTGQYRYPANNISGTSDIRHSHLYLQLAYIHTFNYERAKRALNKQGVLFQSKQERRDAIHKLIGNE